MLRALGNGFLQEPGDLPAPVMLEGDAAGLDEDMCSVQQHIEQYANPSEPTTNPR